MEIEISNLTTEVVDENIITNVIKEASKELNKKDFIISIVLVDNEKIHEINKEYRNVDRETDVISFAFLDEDINPMSDLTNLGEIYISLDKAHEQALNYGHSFLRELSFLTCHGFLHLLGYDHMKEEDEKVMFGLQDKILSSLGIER